MIRLGQCQVNISCPGDILSERSEQIVGFTKCPLLRFPMSSFKVSSTTSKQLAIPLLAVEETIHGFEQRSRRLDCIKLAVSTREADTKHWEPRRATMNRHGMARLGAKPKTNKVNPVAPFLVFKGEPPKKRKRQKKGKPAIFGDHHMAVAQTHVPTWHLGK